MNNNQLMLCIVASSLLLHGCSSGGKTSLSVPSVRVEVKNPLASKAISAMDEITVKASGTLSKGSYQQGKHKIVVDKETTFTLDAVMPINGSAEPDLAAGSGTVTLSHSVAVDGIAVPTKIELKNRTATAAVDFVGVIVSLVANSLPQPGESVLSVSHMVRKLSVQDAKVSLRPEHAVEIGGVSFLLKPGSRILFKDIEYSSDTDYQGHCTIQIADARDVHAKIGDADIKAASISTQLTTRVTGKDGQQVFEVEDAKNCHITLTECTVNSAHDQLQLGKCKLVPAQFRMAVSKGAWKEGNISISGNLDAQQTNVHIDETGKKLSGSIPNLSAAFSMTMAGKDASGSISIPQGVLANSVDITWQQNNETLDLQLNQAKLDKLDVKLPGAISVQAASGDFGLSQLRWRHGNQSVSLKPKGSHATAARIILPAGIAVKGTAANKINCQIKLGPGVLDIASGGKRLTCDDLTGTADVAIDGSNVAIKGNFSAKVKPRQGAFGLPGFDAELGSVGLQLSGKKTALTFENSRLLLSERELSELVQNSLPKTKTINAHKELIQQTPWRYKNLVLEQVVVSKPTVSDIHFVGDNNATANCSAAANLKGTVEKLHPIGALLKRNDGADIKQWSATADVSGPATVKFAVVPGKTLADSRVRADVSFELKKLDNVHLDWSAVSGSLVGKAESGVLSATLAAIKTYMSSHSIPLHTSIEKSLVKRPDPRMKLITIRSLKVVPAPGGAQLLLSGAVDFR